MLGRCWCRKGGERGEGGEEGGLVVFRGLGGRGSCTFAACEGGPWFGFFWSESFGGWMLVGGRDIVDGFRFEVDC